MSDDLSISLRNLRDSASHLNQITDEANGTVRAVEKFLNEECKVGIPVYIATACNEYEQDSEFITYSRIGDNFRIGVIIPPKGRYIDITDLPRDLEIKPWSDCSRDIKLSTFPSLPKLLDKISQEINNRVSSAEESIRLVSGAISKFVGE